MLERQLRIRPLSVDWRALPLYVRRYDVTTQADLLVLLRLFEMSKRAVEMIVLSKAARKSEIQRLRHGQSGKS